ncbi:hypothetical protein QBC35DRAFT_264189 [Podospora australis]|uniref:Uncharacterized protein n=1 Tax=Podospora australis TaxID=1536484 RepID=A0AAN6X4U7_9PEZI|nr:hypothetical protein QBC35DRAFT_264189 [Podospora australis]
MGCRYLAGVWEESFISDLAWKASWNRGSPATKPMTDMPSWSWASIEGAVDTNLDFTEPLGHRNEIARLMDVHGTPRTANRFGDIKDAWATVEGLVFSAESVNHDLTDGRSYKVWFEGSDKLGSAKSLGLCTRHYPRPRRHCFGL